MELKINPNRKFILSRKWEKPPHTLLKLNVNGSCKTHQNLGAIGGLIRNDNGKWILGFAETRNHPTVNDVEIDGQMFVRII